MRVTILVASCLIISSCGVKLPPGENLFVGSSVKIEGTDKGASERKTLSRELQALVRPRPNSKFLGIRFKLMANRIPLLGKRFGEPPVLASTVNFEKNNAVLENRLQNRGYFHATVKFDTVTKRRKTSVDFIANVAQTIYFAWAFA